MDGRRAGTRAANQPLPRRLRLLPPSQPARPSTCRSPAPRRSPEARPRRHAPPTRARTSRSPATPARTCALRTDQEPALEPQLARVKRTRGRSSSTGPAVVATRRGSYPLRWLTGSIARCVPSAPEELRHLILKRLLQDQPRAQPTDPLHRIGLAVERRPTRHRGRGETARSGPFSPCRAYLQSSTREIKAEATPSPMFHPDPGTVPLASPCSIGDQEHRATALRLDAIVWADTCEAPALDDLEERRCERSTRLHCQANASVSVDQIDAPVRRPRQMRTWRSGECFAPCAVGRMTPLSTAGGVGIRPDQTRAEALMMMLDRESIP